MSQKQVTNYLIKIIQINKINKNQLVLILYESKLLINQELFY